MQTNSIESIMKKTWESIFPNESITPESDFFELGGTSLSALRLSSDINSTSGITLDIAVIYEYSSFSKLTKYLEEMGSAV